MLQKYSTEGDKIKNKAAENKETETENNRKY